MMVSPNRLADMKAREESLARMESDLRTGRTESAKAEGVLSAWLANKIKTHDYSALDALDAKYGR